MGCKACEKSIEQSYVDLSEASGVTYLRYRNGDNQLIYVDKGTFDGFVRDKILPSTQEFETI